MKKQAVKYLPLKQGTQSSSHKAPINCIHLQLRTSAHQKTLLKEGKEFTNRRKTFTMHKTDIKCYLKNIKIIVKS